MLIAAFSILIAIVAIYGYLTICYFTPKWSTPALGAPTHKASGQPFTSQDHYTQMLSTPSVRTKHNLPAPEEYRNKQQEMGIANDIIVKEIATFTAPTFIEVDFKVVGKDTIATYHGKATTEEGKSIEYSKDVAMENIVVESVSGYGPVKDTWKE